MTDAAYEKKWGKGPHVTVDAVLSDRNEVILIQRKNGQWALPGGFVEAGQTLRQAIDKELKEECNVYTGGVFHTKVYDSPIRDPRSHIITHVFYFREFTVRYMQAGSDAIDLKRYRWKEVFKLDLYADHSDILWDAFVFYNNSRR